MTRNRLVSSIRPRPRTGRLGSLFAPLLLAAAACGPQAVYVQTRAEPAIEVHANRTWNWGTDSQIEVGLGEEKARFDWRIRSAVERVMGEKRYIRTGSTADLVVRYRLAVEEKTPERLRDLGKYRQAGGTAMVTDVAVRGYEEGVLSLEILDARSGRLVYAGTARAAIEGPRTEDPIALAVDEILAGFPSR